MARSVLVLFPNSLAHVRERASPDIEWMRTLPNDVLEKAVTAMAALAG